VGNTRFELWIDGRASAAEGGATMDVAEPATGGTLATVAQATVGDAQRAAAAAQRAFRAGPWPRARAVERAKALRALAARIRENSQELATLEARNAGKPIGDAEWEVEAAAQCFEFFAGAATTLSGRVPPVDGTGVSLVLRQPVGPCALIVPWNFPLLIAAWKVAPALAAGNTVVLKPASATPCTALRLGALATEAGIPEGVLNVIAGPGAKVGAALVEDPAIR